MACKSLALAPPEFVAEAAALPVGMASGFAFFSGGKLLTLKAASLCCAKPLALIPTITTATANENLIFLILCPEKLNPDELPVASHLSQPNIVRCTHPAIQGSYPSMLNPLPPESTRENKN